MFPLFLFLINLATWSNTNSNFRGATAWSTDFIRRYHDRGQHDISIKRGSGSCYYLPQRQQELILRRPIFNHCRSQSSTSVSGANPNENNPGDEDSGCDVGTMGIDVTGVTLKLALDANGGAADLSAMKSDRFTCSESLDMVHRLRCDSDAVLIGRSTVAVDDPSLTVRRVPCAKPQPVRVVLDPDLALVLQEIKQDYALFRDGLPTIIYHCVKDVDDTMLDLDESVTCVYMPSIATEGSTKARLPLAEVVQNLSKRFDVQHLMVEGGPVTAVNFLKEKLIDRAIIVKAPLCFRQPLDSGITDDLLESSGLICLGTEPCGVDTVQYWSKSHTPWPTERLADWP